MKLLDFAKIYATTEDIINDWKEFNDRDLITLKAIRDNYLLQVYESFNNATPPMVDSAQLLISNMVASKLLITELSKIVSFQHIDDKNIINYMKYIYDENNRMSLVIEPTEAFSSPFPLNIDVVRPSKEELRTQYGIDLEHESYREAAKQLVNNELYSVLSSIVHAHLKYHDKDFTKINIDDFDLFKGSVGSTDCVYKFMFKLQQACSDIARVTRRGIGNRIIVGSKMLKYLTNMSTIFTPNNNVDENSLLPFVGTYVPSAGKVYLSEAFPDKIIIGYVGSNGSCDSSFVYASEIPVLYSGVRLNPVTYEHEPGYMTRYHTHLRNKDYYRIIEINFPEELDSGI